MSYTKAFGQVLSNKKIAADTFNLTVKTPQASDAQIGQFMQIYCEGKTLRRPISICEIDREAETMRMVYLAKGDGTRWLSGVKPGDSLDLLGPIGHGFAVSPNKKILVVGGGIGVPPLLETAKACGGNADAILGFKNANYAILLDDFSKACGDVSACTDDGSLGVRKYGQQRR